MDPANANNLPEATESDIVAEFLSLAMLRGTTTTLEVKNSLRQKDFWVGQNEVSRAIHDYVVANPSEFQIEFSGGHRIYVFTPFQAQVAVPTASWEVYASGGPLGLMPTEQYDNCTRNQARYLYAKQYAVDYLSTTARKV